MLRSILRALKQSALNQTVDYCRETLCPVGKKALGLMTKFQQYLYGRRLTRSHLLQFSFQRRVPPLSQLQDPSNIVSILCQHITTFSSNQRILQHSLQTKTIALKCWRLVKTSFSSSSFPHIF